MATTIKTKKTYLLAHSILWRRFRLLAKVAEIAELGRAYAAE